MAKFVTYYNLCPIHDTKEFLGLSNDKEKGNIIVTLDRNIVRIIKLSSQNLVHSWTTQDKLSLKVVFDKKSGQYVGVFANEYIRCWDMDTLNINKVKKIKFKKKIIEIIASDLLDEVVLLYQDGTCESLSSGINSRKDLPNESSTLFDLQNQTILNPNIFILRNGSNQLTYFIEKDKENNTVELVTVMLMERSLKSSEPIRYPLNRGEQGVNLTGYTVIDGQNFPTLFTIWSDKRIFMMPLKDDVPPSDAPGNFISMLNIFEVNNQISIVGISSQCIAIYGANSLQEGSSLVLYNTQFKVIKAKQFFKIYFDFSRLWVVNNNILLAMGQNLSVVTFRVSREHLSELIGSQLSMDFKSSVNCDFINEEDHLEEVLLFDTQPDNISDIETESVDTDQKKIKFYKNRATMGDNIPMIPYEVFENDFRSVCRNDLQVEVVLTDTIDHIQIDLAANHNDTGFLTEEIDLLAKSLEKFGASEQEITEKLLYTLIKVDNIDEIITCLRRYTYTSERALVKILKYALTNYTLEITEIVPESRENDENEQRKENQNQKDMMNYKKVNLLNVVLSCSFDGENIVGYIRKELDIKQIFALMEHLYSILVNPDFCFEERPETNIDFDEEAIVLRWLSLILNTHFQQLALSRDLKLIKLLEKWLELLMLFKKDFEDLNELSHILYQLIEGKTDFRGKAWKWYSIEEIKLY